MIINGKWIGLSNGLREINKKSIYSVKSVGLQEQRDDIYFLDENTQGHDVNKK